MSDRTISLLPTKRGEILGAKNGSKDETVMPDSTVFLSQNPVVGSPHHLHP